jgi:hypothetical protein
LYADRSVKARIAFAALVNGPIALDVGVVSAPSLSGGQRGDAGQQSIRVPATCAASLRKEWEEVAAIGCQRDRMLGGPLASGCRREVRISWC